MKTKPEGFLWFRKGEFDDDKYAGDLAERIPQLYAKRGFIDFQIVKDTLIVDRERGKALIDITVSEGPRYRVGYVRGRREPALLDRRDRAVLSVRRQSHRR